MKVQDVKNDSEAENVIFRMFCPLHKNFGSEITGCSTFFEEICAVSHWLHHPKVDDHWPISIILSAEHNIFQFDVTVEESLQVHVVHRLQQIVHNSHHLTPVKLFETHQQTSQSLLVIFLNDVDCIVRFIDPLESANSFVLALHQSFEFTHKGILL
jgi:hypothetical protein